MNQTGIELSKVSFFSVETMVQYSLYSTAKWYKPFAILPASETVVSVKSILTEFSLKDAKQDFDYRIASTSYLNLYLIFLSGHSYSYLSNKQACPFIYLLKIHPTCLIIFLSMYLFLPVCFLPARLLGSGHLLGRWEYAM